MKRPAMQKRGAVPPSAPEGSAPDAERDDVVGVLDQLPGSGLRVLLYKENPGKPGSYDYADEMGADAFSLGAVREAFGAGRYRVKLRDPETNRWQRQATFSIAAPLAGVQTASHPAARTDRSDELLQALIAKVAAPPPDPMASFATLAGALAPLLTPVVTALLNKKGGDPLEVATKLVELTQGNKPAGDLGAFLRGLEMGKSLEGGGDAGSFAPVLREIAGPLAQVLTSAASRPAVPPPAVARAATPQQLAGSAAPQIPPAESPDVLGDPFLLALRQYVPALRAWAERQVDPELRAAVVAEELPAFAVPMVRERIAAPDVTARILAAFPPLQPFAAWCEAFVVALRAELSDDADPDDGGDDAAGA